MKIFDKKLAITFVITFTLLIGFFATGATGSYALTLSEPQIISFGKSPIEENALKLDIKANNEGNDFSFELYNVTTNKKNNLAGSATTYTYQNLESGKEYKVKIRVCSNESNTYICSNWSMPEVAIAGAIPENVKSVELDTNKFTYDGYEKNPSVIVKDNEDATLTIDKDYVVTYPEGRTDIGTYVVKVTGRDNYNFTKDLKFKIVPPETAIKKTKSATTNITITMKSAKGSPNYQVGYKKSSASKYTTKNSSSTTKKITGLKKNTSYKIRVRTYKKVGDDTYYSGWSAVKTVKTTKKGTSTKSYSTSTGDSTSSGGSGSSSGTSGGTSGGSTSVKTTCSSKKPKCTATGTCLSKSKCNTWKSRQKSCTNSKGKWNKSKKQCSKCPSYKKLSSNKYMCVENKYNKEKCANLNKNYSTKSKKCLSGCITGYYEKSSDKSCSCLKSTKKCYSSPAAARSAKNKSSNSKKNKTTKKTYHQKYSQYACYNSGGKSPKASPGSVCTSKGKKYYKAGKYTTSYNYTVYKCSKNSKGKYVETFAGYITSKSKKSGYGKCKSVNVGKLKYVSRGTTTKACYHIYVCK